MSVRPYVLNSSAASRMNSRTAPTNSGGTSRSSATSRHWSLDDIPWQAIRRDALAANEGYFYLIAAASLMESATDLYTRNLIDFFGGDKEITFMAGEALVAGGAAARPGAAPLCRNRLAGIRLGTRLRALCRRVHAVLRRGARNGRSLEMASRCVVETGTASYYTTLSRASPDPVLATWLGASPKTKYATTSILRFFRRYREAEHPSRAAVLPALWRRLRMSGGDDSFIVLKHVHRARHPARGFRPACISRAAAEQPPSRP